MFYQLTNFFLFILKKTITYCIVGEKKYYEPNYMINCMNSACCLGLAQNQSGLPTRNSEEKQNVTVSADGNNYIATQLIIPTNEEFIFHQFIIL